MITRSSFAFYATIALLVGTIAFGHTLGRRTPEQLVQSLETVASDIGGWRVAEQRTLDERVLRRLVPTSYLARTYRKDQTNLDLFIAYYAEQKAGESMHSPKHCLPGSGWEIWKHDSADVAVNGKSERINMYG